MDDLDHSMHIAEYDWTSFYDESEELGLPQASLAYPDISSLSDSEDSVDFNEGQQEPKQSPADNGDEAESNVAACGVEESQTDQRGSTGEPDDLKTNVEDGESCGGPDKSLNHPEGNDTDETNVDVTTTLQPEQRSVRSSDGAMQTETDTSSTLRPDPLSRHQTGLSVSEPQAADRAASGDASGDAPRGEKERWFVTVNDSPARQRAVRAVSGKKKRRQKKPSKNNQVRQTPGREKSCENGLALEITVENNESEAGGVTQLTPNTSGEFQSAEENHESAHAGVVPNLSQMSLTSSEEDNPSEKLVTSETIEPTTDRDKPDPDGSKATSRHTFAPTDPSRLDSVESDEFGDAAEFFSSHSYDSESYASASESAEEPQHLLVQSSPSLTPPLDRAENRDAEDATDADAESSHHGGLACDVTATYSQGHESADVEPTPASPSVAQGADKTPDDNSTCDNRTLSTPLRAPSDTPGLQKRETNPPASGGSSGDRPSLPPVPDLTLTPCPVADSPEAYVEATGHAQPVYAISAFWDEMEKLTINDILQLRMGRSTPPRDTQETATSNVDGFLTNHRSSIDAVDNSSSDGGLMDTSDTADSDYFTQPDEFKPDRSSCEFSTSDFEEEYWQFLGASRNASPDPQNKKQPTTDSPFFADEEEESTGSEGKETPVPSEDPTGQWFDDRDASASISSGLAWPRPITKSKSVRNVQALSTDDVSLQFLLASDESGLSPSSRLPHLEESVLPKASDISGTLIPATFLSGTDKLDELMSFPGVFGEYLFTEDDMKSDSRVAVYNPEDISVSPAFDYALCTFTDETSLVPLRDSKCIQDKPIPIFSCSHPTVRELAFPPPQYVFLSTDSKEDVFSPIRVVSRSFNQGRDFWTPPPAARGSGSWASLLSIRKIRFHDKGSIWCGSAGSWVFPVEEEEITVKRADPPVTVLAEESDSSALFQLCRDMAAQRAILETIRTTRQHGIFATLKQSDMCLVCIAFASWVLRSSDPEAADAWKAALLANVSALSAIQYLRHYVKKRNQEYP